jgi:hypothetical protein
MISKEKFSRPADSISFNMETRLSEGPFLKIKGEVFWTLRDGTTGEETKGHINNIVTLDASILIARLIKSPPVPNLSTPAFGVYALAVGTGDLGWPALNPPIPTQTQRSLYNELARKAVASSNFINAGGGISAIPTNVVDFTTTFSESEAVGPLMEMGLLGGDINTNMTITNPILPANGPFNPLQCVRGKDALVNYITFPTITKPPTSTLTWVWRLSF